MMINKKNYVIVSDNIGLSLGDFKDIMPWIKTQRR